MWPPFYIDIMKVTIIGAGPGGYETALYLAKRGVDVDLVYAGELGGTCLNEGCIPTKCFCRNAEALDIMSKAGEFGLVGVSETPAVDFAKVRERKDGVVSQLRSGIEFLMKNPHITLHKGKASFKDAHTVLVDGAEEIVSDKVIIATGSISATLPIPGNDLPGVITSKEILELEELPKRLCVIGAGVIGLEFASIFKSFGCEVTVLEYCKDILPRFDTDLAKRLKQVLGKRGINIETAAQVKGIVTSGDALEVAYSKKDKDFAVVADKVLMAVGRRPALASLNLDEIGIEYGPRGVVVDAAMHTNVPDVYAIGDITGGMMLAHVSTFQGKVAAEDILGGSSKIRLEVVPAAVFTSPEAATVGLTEDWCKDNGISVKCTKAMFRANGKALSMGEPEGFCKIVAAAGDDVRKPGQILGCHMFGAHSADIIQEIAALMNVDATVEDLTSIIHAHPTLTEILLAAAE